MTDAERNLVYELFKKEDLDYNQFSCSILNILGKFDFFGDYDMQGKLKSNLFPEIQFGNHHRANVNTFYSLIAPLLLSEKHKISEVSIQLSDPAGWETKYLGQPVGLSFYLHGHGREIIARANALRRPLEQDLFYCPKGTTQEDMLAEYETMVVKYENWVEHVRKELSSI
jgi:hypothetical protein